MKANVQYLQHLEQRLADLHGRAWAAGAFDKDDALDDWIEGLSEAVRALLTIVASNAEPAPADVPQKERNDAI